MGSKMRHDALKVLLARVFEEAGFSVRMEQSAGFLDKRRPADVEVEDWVVISKWEGNKALTIDVAITDSTGDSYSTVLKLHGVGAAATHYEDRKRNTYKDIKDTHPLFSKLNGGFGKEAKRLVRELERRRKKRVSPTHVIRIVHSIWERSIW